MIKGIYRAASGMLPRVTRQETISNNLANVNTPGFKRQGVFIEELNRYQQRVAPKQEEWETPMISDIYTDHSEAIIDRTGSQFDLALDGSGFLVVESENGDRFYTRAGNFTMSPEGVLTNADGLTLMSDTGPINMAEGGSFEVSSDGLIVINGQETGRLEIVDFEKPYDLERVTGTLFRATDPSEEVEPERVFIRQGYIDRANVDVISEIVYMITSFREYEANQKAIHIADETLQKTVNQVGAKR
jgi:flagellar basal-body rod protein FlgF